MLNLTAKELSEMTNTSNGKIDELGSALLAGWIEIRRLIQERETMERDLKKEQAKIEAIREATVLNEGIPRRVSVVRDALLKVMSQVKSKNITITKLEILETTKEELKEELQQKCNHPFVFHKEGYSGSSSDDFEDGYPSERYCVVCGLEERAKDFCENGIDNTGSVFETLKSLEDRVIHREPYRPHPNPFSRKDIWVTLGAALKPFEEEVARILNS